MKKIESTFYSKWLVMPALVLFLVFFIIPNLASFIMGFTDWSMFYFDEPRWNGLENFRRLFSEKNFWICVKNTFYFAIVTVIGKNVIGFLLALLVQKKSKYNNFLRASFFLPITISPMVVAIIFVSLYNPTNGLINKEFVEQYIDKIFATPEEDGSLRLQIKIFTGETTDKYLQNLRSRTGHTFKNKYGKNAILKGMNLEEGATAKDRNEQIGGHRA